MPIRQDSVEVFSICLKTDGENHAGHETLPNKTHTGIRDSAHLASSWFTRLQLWSVLIIGRLGRHIGYGQFCGFSDHRSLSIYSLSIYTAFTTVIAVGRIIRYVKCKGWNLGFLQNASVDLKMEVKIYLWFLWNL